MNAIEPVGTPLPGAFAFTAAVKVTDWPNTAGSAREATELVVAAAFTVFITAEDVLPV